MIIAIFTVAVLVASTVAAPQAAHFRCGSQDPPDDFFALASEMHQRMAPRDVSSADPLLEIDTYIHFVIAGVNDHEGRINGDQLVEQFKIMQKSFAPSGIRFELKDFDITVNSRWADAQDEWDMKKSLHRGTYETLNLYIIRSFEESDIIGECTRPRPGIDASDVDYMDDGCTILALSLPGGRLSNVFSGVTAVHEIGHWLGLSHTFHRRSCSSSGDLISDTPRQRTPASGCPTAKDSCPNYPGLDPIHNYMDYSDDKCKNEFTPDQAHIMHFVFGAMRRGK